MKKFVCSAFLLVGAFVASAQSLTALEIISKADEARQGESSYNESEMTIVRPKWSRSYSIKSWTKGNDLSLIKITAPAKDAGQGYLKIDKDLWNWMPSIDRMIKMSSSIMGQSWMGSDFTNDDMVRQVSIVDDYSQKLLGEEKVREYDCWKIELIPDEDAPVVWDRTVCWVDKRTFGIVKTENYDEDGILVQLIDSYDLKPYCKRVIPTRTEVIPVQEEGKKTVMVMKKAQFDQKIDNNFFSQQNLKRLK